MGQAVMSDDTAPKKTGRPKGSNPATRKYAGKLSNAALKLQLDQTLTMIGLIVSTRNEFDGTTIIEGAPKLADSLAELAKGNDRVRRALEAIVSTSGYAGVLTAAGGIIYPILVNHGILPNSLGLEIPNSESKDTDGNSNVE